MVKKMRKIYKGMYVSELDEINQDLLFNMLYECAYKNNVESVRVFVDNGMRSRLSDLSDTINIDIIIDRLKKGGNKMKIKHVRTIYTKKLKSGKYSNAKENIEVEENFVSLDFFKSFTSDENIKYFNSRVQRTYEKVGFVPTRLVMYSPNGDRYIDEFIFLD